MEKGKKTRQMILEKSSELFADQGFRRITMKDICLATGLSRGGLYRHFGSTNEIFEALLQEMNQKDELDFTGAMQQGIRATEIMEKVLDLLKKEMDEPGKSLSLAIYEFSQEKGKSTMDSLNETGSKQWVDLIEYGIKRGEFLEVDAKEVADVLLYAYQGVRMWSRVSDLSAQVSTNIVNNIRRQLGMKQKEE